jgi:hypothetical protein
MTRILIARAGENDDLDKVDKDVLATFKATGTEWESE